jgi:tripartite-type tricarboxylate transporter receptor subunit TctC
MLGPIPARSSTARPARNVRHLCAELFKQLAGLRDIVHVPYWDANSGLIDFYAGQLSMFAASISPQVLAMHHNGTIRVLVAGASHRPRVAPDIPIGSDVGFPELITVQFIGPFAPRGTPAPIINTVAAMSREVSMKPDVQQRLIEDGFEPLTDSGPEEATTFSHAELIRWTPVLKALGISGGEGVFR